MKSAEEVHGELSREERLKVIHKVSKLPLAQAWEVTKDALANHPFHWVASGPGAFAVLPVDLIALVLRHLSRGEQLQVCPTCPCTRLVEHLCACS